MKYQLWSWHLTYCKAHYRYKSYKLGLNQTCKLSLNSTFCEAGKPLSGSFRYLHQWWNALQASDPLLWFTGNIDARPPATLDTLLEIWTFMNRVLNTHITLSLRLQWWAALCPRYVTPKLALRFSAHIRQARRLTVVTQHWGFWRSRRYHYERHICSNRWTFGDVGGDIGVSGWCTKYGGEFSRDPSDIQLSDIDGHCNNFGSAASSKKWRLQDMLGQERRCKKFGYLLWGYWREKKLVVFTLDEYSCGNRVRWVSMPVRAA